MKGIRITMPVFLQQKALNQLQINKHGMEKTRLLAHESIYWININNDTENAIKLPRMSYIQAELPNCWS